MIYVVDKQLKWQNLVNQQSLIYLASQKEINSKEALIFELMKIVDQEFSYVGDLPLEIKKLAAIHSYKLTNITFESDNALNVKSFLLNYRKVFTLKQYQEWFKHLNDWEDIFNYMVANNIIVSCKLGFITNSLMPASPLLDLNFNTLGPICKSLLQSTNRVIDPLLGDVEAGNAESDDWMSE